MADTNKVKYGLEHVYVAVATIDPDTNTATYATPIHIPGARSLSMEPQGEMSEWYADNIVYYVTNANNGYQGDLEVARFPDTVMAAIWAIATAANGLQYEAADTQAVHFALLFEFSGDQQKTRHVFYNCTATRPTVSGSTTEDTIEPQTETCTITATSINVAALSKEVVKAKCNEGDAAYASWYTAVVQPTSGQNQ